MPSDFCPAIEYFHLPIVIAALNSKPPGALHYDVQVLPVKSRRKGTQLLPLDFLDSFPALNIKANITNFHVFDYSMVNQV